MWMIGVDGFLSIVEYMPPKTTVVTPAKYETVTEAVKQYDEKLKREVVITPAVTKKISDEVRVPFTDPYEGQLKDYSRGTYDTVDKETGEKIPGTLSSHLLVRARIEADLDAVKAYDPDAISVEDKYADYQFRLIIRREAVAKYQYDLTMGINYTSHAKEEMNKRSPHAEGRMTAYYAIWTALSKIQPVRPYSGGVENKYNWDDYSYGSTKKYKGTGTGYVSAFGAVEGPYVPKAAGGSDVLAGVKGKGVGKADNSLLDDVLATLPDVDDPGNQMWWEQELAIGQPTRRTMESQIADILRAVGEIDNYDVPDVTDKVEEQFGTCDIDVIDTQEFWETVDTCRLVGAEDSPLVKVL